MSETTKKHLTYVGVAIVVVFVLFLWPHSQVWDGDGTINAFPSSDSVKSYRLDAHMTVTRHWRGWLKANGPYEYSGITGKWPNGGTLELGDCVVRDKNQSQCTGQDGSTYGIDVHTAPDPPDPEPSDSNF
jgi:hypothetical protein